ncbi:Alpha/beta hydrolase fold-containing protein 16 [Elsinoe fawcettii]|nr:Alpha/beta hydrolase fold-containing protein 16 [Elsinoe fawcettii]
MESLLYTRNKALATLLRLTIPRIPISPDATVLTIPTHLYLPSSPSTPSKILINFHGSGFLLPLHGSDAPYCSLLASKGWTVLDAAYRLAPEYPFPAAVQDAEDVVRWALSQPERFDLSNVVVGGFSAGGTLALGLAGSVFPSTTFRACVLFYPPTRLDVDPWEKKPPEGEAGGLFATVAGLFDSSYVPVVERRKEVLVSPGLIEGGKWPERMMFVTAGKDMLAVEAEDLAGRIVGEGRTVVIKRMEGVGHAFDKDRKEGSLEGKRRDEAYDAVVEFLNTL